MANSIASSNMTTMFDEIIQEADIKVGLSKSLEVYRKDDEAWQQANGTVWIPEAYNLETQDGFDSTGTEEDLIDRMIPVNLAKKKHIKVVIGAEQLRDGRISTEAKKAMVRQIKNTIDIACFEEIINRGTMLVRSTSDFIYGNAVSANVLMDDAGLSGFEQKLCLSTPHYSQIAETLGTSAFKDSTNLSAFEKLQIPQVAGFQSMKADYRKSLAGNATTGLTVNGNQSHTVATYTDANKDNYLDNSQMTLAVTGATAGNMPKGTKLNIAGVFGVQGATREDLGSLKTFSVVSAAAGSVVISPAIIITGPNKNCSAQAATGVAITVLNTTTSAPSIFYTDDSVYLVPGRLPVASEATNIATEEMVMENGIPVRFSYWWSPDAEKLNIKIVLFFDVVVTSPEKVGLILANQA
jgi:hypothetical protein